MAHFCVQVVAAFGGGDSLRRTVAPPVMLIEDDFVLCDRALERLLGILAPGVLSPVRHILPTDGRVRAGVITEQNIHNQNRLMFPDRTCFGLIATVCARIDRIRFRRRTCGAVAQLVSDSSLIRAVWNCDANGRLACLRRCTGVKIPAFRYLPKTHDLGPDSGRSAPSHVNVII